MKLRLSEEHLIKQSSSAQNVLIWIICHQKHRSKLSDNHSKYPIGWLARLLIFYDGLSVIFQGAPRKTTKKRQSFYWRQRQGRSDPFPSSHMLCISYFLSPFLSQQLYSFTPVTAGQSETCVGGEEKEERGHETEKVIQLCL